MGHTRGDEETPRALLLAERLLDEPNVDPDDDLRVLSRQLIRQTDRLLEAAWVPSQMARKHREAMATIEASDPELEGKGNGEEHDIHRFIAEALEDVASQLRGSPVSENRATFLGEAPAKQQLKGE